MVKVKHFGAGFRVGLDLGGVGLGLSILGLLALGWG